MKIFPVAKSTELMFLNETDWEKFAQATGAAYDDLSTVEGWWPLPVPIMTGPTPRRRSRTTARLCSAATPWPTTCWWGPAAGRHPVRGAGRKDDLELDKDVARKAVGQLLCARSRVFAAIGRFRSDE